MTKNDKRRTVMVKGQKVHFTYFDPKDISIQFDQITSVGVVLFTTDKNLVAVELDRGLDIPGGHVQHQDNSILDTAKREALEEAYAIIKDVKLIQIIQSDYYGSKPDQLTYLVTVAAIVETLLPFEPNKESRSRHVSSPRKFIERYEAGPSDGMRKVIAKAINVLFDSDGGYDEGSG